ncbi:hypothetical protein ABW20_dc0106182 [Dactylellina cionopaga]|nr:hypothetical protein ABW20_dc0106182 [Dactylellina cionopaga]
MGTEASTPPPTTDANRVVYPTELFDSFDALFDDCMKRTKQAGYTLSRYRIKRDNGTIKSSHLRCALSEAKQPSKAKGIRKLAPPSRTDCPFSIAIYGEVTAGEQKYKYRLHVFNGSHNHDPTPQDAPAGRSRKRARVRPPKTTPVHVGVRQPALGKPVREERLLRIDPIVQPENAASPQEMLRMNGAPSPVPSSPQLVSNPGSNNTPEGEEADELPEAVSPDPPESETLEALGTPVLVVTPANIESTASEQTKDPNFLRPPPREPEPDAVTGEDMDDADADNQQSRPILKETFSDNWDCVLHLRLPHNLLVYQVSKHVLANASPEFGHLIPSHAHRFLVPSDSDPDALRQLLQMLHFKPEADFFNITFDRLKQLAILCHRFKLQRALLPWSRFWIEAHGGTAMLPGHEDWLFIWDAFVDTCERERLEATLAEECSATHPSRATRSTVIPGR